ncbi:uncharacterized protein E0L32_012425 [Thyridium curvatum]|uniref:Wbp11/ELF5/Saf1 N-terminal domain-containing protein n=1 Tax=Thyridium curvatum TaxID=1093900 RepID=A0A507BHE0_9PEZI|nr:uncharacterized protein E0L32_012425 [Thyridium curvatum]TPX16411.1 hypothetical protein E0L32_012425 [Thyridium curvatum]
MAKERSVNPVQAQRKADKAKAIKKGKAEVANRRNERLAQRNPQRLQKQIDDLKAVASGGGGKLTRHEEQMLEGLEKELKAVEKAREALGDKAPQFRQGFGGGGGDRGGVLGKRRRDAEDASSSDEEGGKDVPEDVRRIPMPRDTPPPIPKEVMDKWWARRRARRNDANANTEPLGGGRGFEEGGADKAGEEQQQQEKGGRWRRQQQQTPAVVAEAKTVYEARPIVRDLRKEATSAFVPTAVRMKIDKSKGQGGLMEPEEADRLEREGYLKKPAAAADADAATESRAEAGPRQVTMEEVEDEEH